MSRVRGRNTSLEVKFRKKLWARGLRYRLGYKLIGKPDLVFVNAKVAVFIDGCFWHGCPLHGQIPKTNGEFWKIKIGKNVARDKTVSYELGALGWKVIRFWEHELKQDVERCIEDVYSSIRRAVNSGT